MIDKEHELSVTRQTQLLDLSRSTAYYRPQPTSESDLHLMREIDRLHLEHPFAGARMLRAMLGLKHIAVGRKHVRTLMKKMDIEALYRKANTSRRHQAHRSIPTSCATVPSTARIRSGRWTRRTFRCSVVSSI